MTRLSSIASTQYTATYAELPSAELPEIAAPPMDRAIFETVTPLDAESPPLSLLLAILGDFRRQNLSYCYWKSSRRVSAALSGETDLDLLIARTEQHRAQAILL